MTVPSVALQLFQKSLRACAKLRGISLARVSISSDPVPKVGYWLSLYPSHSQWQRYCKRTLPWRHLWAGEGSFWACVRTTFCQMPPLLRQLLPIDHPPLFVLFSMNRFLFFKTILVWWKY